MKGLSTEVKVGLFAIAAVLLVVFFVGRTGDVPDALRGNQGYRLYAHPQNVSGIAEKTGVEIAGVQVGVVDKIELTMQEGDETEGARQIGAKLTLRIKDNVKLPLDSRLVIQPKGALGSKIIAIQPGVATGSYLEDGDTIKTGEPPPDFDQMIKRVDDVTRDVKDITTVLRDTMGSEEAEERFSNILANIENFSADMADVSAANREALSEIVENMRILSSELREVIERTNDGVDSSFDDLERAADKLDATLTSVSSVAEKIDDGEGTIGKLINDPTTAEGLETAVEGVNDIVERVNRIKIFIDYHGEALAFGPTFGFDEELALKNYLGLRIQPHPDYYYAIELVDDPKGKVTNKTTTYVEHDAAGNVINQTTVDEHKVEDQFKITLQFARRVHNATFRLGIKEDTGGVGMDYDLFKDKLRFSFDAFDFSSRGDENPHLKLMATYNVHKHIFLVGGGDDLISIRNPDGTCPAGDACSSRAFFIGAGLTFNDDDLKWVMGSLPIPGM